MSTTFRLFACFFINIVFSAVPVILRPSGIIHVLRGAVSTQKVALPKTARCHACAIN